MKIQEVNEDFIFVTVQQAWDWMHRPGYVAQIDDKGNMTGTQPKEDLPGNMTCRLRILLHCIRHPDDEVGFQALCKPDKVELIKLRELNSKKKRRRRKK